jgi:hypothetical protein
MNPASASSDFAAQMQVKRRVGKIRQAAKKVLGKTAYGNPTVQIWVERLARGYVGELVKLRSSVSGGRSSRRSIRNQLLGRAGGRICCVLVAAAKRRLSMSRAEVELVAASIRPWSDCGEPVRAISRQKPDGDVRWTVCFGVKRLALSYLCRDVLAAWWGPMIHEFNAPSGGVERAIESLSSWISHDRPWVLTADVKEFFPSIGYKGMIELVPLPESVIRHSLSISEDVHILSDEGMISSATKALRQGLPQGSPASSVIATRMFALTVGQIADQAIWSYSDNLFSAFDDEQTAQATLSALVKGFTTHPAGELKLHKIKIAHCDDGIDLLGYNLRTLADAPTWKPFARPSHSAFDKFFKKLADKLVTKPTAGLYDFAVERTESWIKGRTIWNATPKGIDIVMSRALTVAATEAASRLTSA